MLDGTGNLRIFPFSYAKPRRLTDNARPYLKIKKASPAYNPPLALPKVSYNPHSPASLHTSGKRRSVSY